MRPRSPSFVYPACNPNPCLGTPRCKVHRRQVPRSVSGRPSAAARFELEFASSGQAQAASAQAPQAAGQVKVPSSAGAAAPRPPQPLLGNPPAQHVAAPAPQLVPTAGPIGSGQQVPCKVGPPAKQPPSSRQTVTPPPVSRNPPNPNAPVQRPKAATPGAESLQAPQVTGQAQGQPAPQAAQACPRPDMFAQVRLLGGPQPQATPTAQQVQGQVPAAAQCSGVRVPQTPQTQQPQ